MRFVASQEICRILYKSTRGIALSKIDRVKDGLFSPLDPSLTYGEVDQHGFESLLRTVCSLLLMDQQQPQLLEEDEDRHERNGEKVGNIRTFVDLGSGTGKAVIIAGLTTSFFQICHGIELLPSLFVESNKRLDQLTRCIASSSSSSSSICSVLVLEPKMRKNSTAKPKAPPSLLSVHDFILLIKKVILIHEEEGVAASQATVANELVKTMGHKAYAATLRASAYKTLTKFFLAHPLHFSFSTADDAVTVVMDDREASEREKEEEKGEKEELGVVVEEGEIDVKEVVKEDTDAEGERALMSCLKKRGVLEALSPLPTFCFSCGSIFDSNWFEQADVAYCANLLFPEHMLRTLFVQALRMRPGSAFVSLRPFPHDLLEMPIGEEEDSEGGTRTRVITATLKERSFYQFSWQKAEVYIYMIEIKK